MTETPTEENNSSEEKSRKERIILWLKRLGLAGFLFFLLKGLIWLAIFFSLTKISCFGN
jgi:hypothetical protein